MTSVVSFLLSSPLGMLMVYKELTDNSYRKKVSVWDLQMKHSFQPRRHWRNEISNTLTNVYRSLALGKVKSINQIVVMF